jgi:hypothetical protein
MKRRITTRGIQVIKKCKLGVEGRHAYLPTEFTQVDNGKLLSYNHVGTSLQFVDNPGQDPNADLKCRDLEVSRDIKMTNLDPNIVLDSQSNLTITGGKLKIENTQINLESDGITLRAPFIRLDSKLTNDIPYTLPTSLIPGQKFLKSDSSNGTAYWGDAPTQPTIGATNLAANWNWDYNSTRALASPTFTEVLPISISPVNAIINGYVVNNISNIYQTEVGSWGNHKFSINVNIESGDNNDLPVRAYAIYFKSNGIAWNYLRNVMNIRELCVVAASSALDCSILTEVVDRPHSGYLSMYGAGSFSIPESDKAIYTGYVQSYISSLLYVSGNIICYGFPSNGITEAPSINPAFAQYNRIYSNYLNARWFFDNGTSRPSYALVNQYGARANSWLVLSSTSEVYPYAITTTCLKVIDVETTEGGIAFLNDSNYTDFLAATNQFAVIRVLYVLDNWTSPPVYVSNNYTVKITGLKTEIYQISPKGEPGEVGITAIDDTTTTGNRTWSSTKINNNLNLKADTTALTAGLTLKNDLITSSTNLNAASVSCDTLTSASTGIAVSKGLALGVNGISAATATLNTLTSSNASLAVTKAIALGANNLSTTGTLNTGILSSGASNIVVNKPLALGTNSITTSSVSASTVNCTGVLTCPQVTTLETQVRGLNSMTSPVLCLNGVTTTITPPNFFRGRGIQQGSGILMIQGNSNVNSNRGFSVFYRYTFHRSDYSGTQPQLILTHAIINSANGNFATVAPVFSLIFDTTTSQPYDIILTANITNSFAGDTGSNVFVKLLGCD